MVDVRGKVDCRWGSIAAATDDLEVMSLDFRFAKPLR